MEKLVYVVISIEDIVCVLGSQEHLALMLWWWAFARERVWLSDRAPGSSRVGGMATSMAR